MDKKSLESLLFKMVLVTRTKKKTNADGTEIQKTYQFKGYLQKRYSGSFYVKVVEGLNSSFERHEFEELMDDDIVVHADKPKLMHVTNKSITYKIMKYVLRSKAPTPKNMQNGCPYFYLLIFSIIACPFVFLYKTIIDIILFPFRMFENFMEYCVDKWLETLSDEEIGEIYLTSDHIYKSVPLHVKQYRKSKGDYSLIDKYLTKKYGKKYDFNSKREEIHTKWIEWRKKREKEKYEIDRIYWKKRLEREKIEKERQDKWDAKIKPYKDFFDKLGQSVKNSVNKAKSQKNIIKRTKQFIGFVITLFFLFASMFIVYLLVAAIIMLIDLLILYWAEILIILGIVAFIFLLYGFVSILTSWISNLAIKYNEGKKIWYIQPLVWFIVVPLKYLALGIFYYIVKPIVFVSTRFYDIVLYPIGKLISYLSKKTYHTLLTSTGVFGEYFGAGFNDFCPGLEWDWVEEDENENENK